MRSTQKEFKITVDGQGKEVVSVFVSLIKKGMRVVDVGAYHGFFSFLASKLVGEGGEVIAFEPLPEAFRFLRMGCKNLKLKNVRIYNYAVSDKIGTRKLRVNGSGSHFLREDDIFQPYVIVKTVSLDSFLSNKKIDVAIINVEGAELEVLRGMKETLSRYEVKIICEVHPVQLSYLGYRLEELENFLKELNYKIFHISNKGLAKTNKFFEERAHYLFLKPESNLPLI